MFGMASGERFWQRRPFDGVLKLLESKFMVYIGPWRGLRICGTYTRIKGKHKL